MWHHFRLIPFLAGLGVGYLVLRFYKTPVKTVYEYPHPNNMDRRVYKDTNGVCYAYSAKEVNCDDHEDSLKPYPLQA